MGEQQPPGLSSPGHEENVIPSGQTHLLNAYDIKLLALSAQRPHDVSIEVLVCQRA
jgi:hypothetical protein